MDPVQRLKLSQRIREAAEELEAKAIEEARENGMTWGDIGACYGLSKQGAQQRFKNARPEKAGSRRKHQSRE